MDATDAMDPDLYKSALAKLFQREKGTSWTTEETMILIEVWTQQEMQDIIEDNPRDHTPYLAMVDGLKKRDFVRTWLQCRVKTRNLTFWYKTVKKRLMLYPDSTVSTLKKPQKDLLAKLDPILKNKRIQFTETDIDNASNGGSDQEPTPPPSARVVIMPKDGQSGGTGAQVLSSSASNRAPSTSPLKIIRMTQNKASSEPVLIKDEPGDDGTSTGQKSPLPIETSGAKIHLIQPSNDFNKYDGFALSNILPSEEKPEQHSIQNTEMIQPIATISSIYSVGRGLDTVASGNPGRSGPSPTPPSDVSSVASDVQMEPGSSYEDIPERGQKRKPTDTEEIETKRQKVYDESEGYLFVFEMVDKLLDSQRDFQDKLIKLEEKRLQHDDRLRLEIQKREDKLRKEQTEREETFRKEQLKLRLESEERLKQMQNEFDDKQRKERLEWEERQKKEEREHQIKVMHTLAQLFHNQKSTT